MKNIIIIITLTLCTLIPLFLSIAFYTVVERKVIAAIQRRYGPNLIGFAGLLQAFADGLKLILKEVIIPFKSSTIIFLISPITVLTLSLINWSFIPFSIFNTLFHFKYGLLIIMTISSLSVYGIIFAGWASNSKYPFLGALRSAAQIISYELILMFIIFIIALVVGSFNFIEIVEIQNKIKFIIPFFPLFLLFGIGRLAETNRAPFDLPEAEAEIVAGYNLEYSSRPFAFFFLSEYSNIILISIIIILLFLGTWCFLTLKILSIALLYILIRATLPRLRYDQLRLRSWKIILPFLLSYTLLIISILSCFSTYTTIFYYCY